MTALIWLQLNLALARTERPAPESARRVFAALEPVIDSLRANERLASFYFMRKPPDLRLRLLARADVQPEVEAVLDELVREAAVERWFPSVYEPEAARFGGPEAMAAAHVWFDVDTRLWIRLDRLRARGGAVLAPEAVCVAVAHDLVSGSVDGRAEAWDVWRSYAESVGPSATADETLQELPNLHAMAEQASPDEAGVLAEYARANAAFSAALRTVWSSGKLLRGLRAVVGTMILFHFHRHGLSPRAHATLASEMSRLLTPSPK